MLEFRLSGAVWPLPLNAVTGVVYADEEIVHFPVLYLCGTFLAVNPQIIKAGKILASG